jgi:hypothetical protein
MDPYEEQDIQERWVSSTGRNQENNMTRNVFENNEEPVVDGEKLAGQVEATLPPLSKGYHYALETLENGRTAVTVEEDAEPSYPDLNITVAEPLKYDRFGRKMTQ